VREEKKKISCSISHFYHCCLFSYSRHPQFEERKPVIINWFGGGPLAGRAERPRKKKGKKKRLKRKKREVDSRAS